MNQDTCIQMDEDDSKTFDLQTELHQRIISEFLINFCSDQFTFG